MNALQFIENRANFTLISKIKRIEPPVVCSAGIDPIGAKAKKGSKKASGKAL
jgi:hypothetical protein